jgi:hypothetical protein
MGFDGRRYGWIFKAMWAGSKLGGASVVDVQLLTATFGFQ